MPPCSAGRVKSRRLQGTGYGAEMGETNAYISGSTIRVPVFSLGLDVRALDFLILKDQNSHSLF
jgi:hypothetical protein